MKIIFVTGKGGVGKSAVAAALALKEAQKGAKTLLVELGHTSFYRDYFSTDEIGYNPIPLNLEANLKIDIALWSGAECLKEYAQHLLKIESLYKLFFENAVTRSFMGVAPALTELALLGKVTSQHRKVGPTMNYDCLVVDGYATGHFLALLKAPQGMGEVVRVGPMGEQSRGIAKILSDSDICEYYVVAIAEELPVLEAKELSSNIQAIVGIKPKIILNKLVKPSPASLQEQNSKLQNFQDYLRQVSAAEKKYSDQIASDAKPLQLAMVFSANAKKIVSSLAAGL